MPAPTVNYQTVAVSGKYVALDGDPMVGTVTFTAPYVLTDAAADTIIIPSVITATLDTNGEFTVNVPASDDPDISPTGWSYTVTESLRVSPSDRNTRTRSYDIEVPLAAAATGIELSDVTPVDPIVPAAPSPVTSVDGQTGAVSLSGTYAPVRRNRVGAFPEAKGAVCFTWDDGFLSWDTIRQMANARGQRHTFCVQTNRIDNPLYLSSANVAALAADGHEIAAHSVTHARMAAITSAARQSEWDTSKSALEAIVGAGKVTTWCYPYGTASSPAGRDATCDREAYGRYDRLLDTGPLGVHEITDRSPFLISRRAFDDSTQAEVLDLIRLAAVKPVIVTLFSHDVGTGGGQPSMAQVTEAMDLAQSLGVPCLTTAEAFPRSCLLQNATFESGVLGPWRIARTDATHVADVQAVTPDTGLAGTRAVRLGTPNSAGNVLVKQPMLVTAGKQYTLSFRSRLTDTSAAIAGGTVYGRVAPLDYAGVEQAWVPTTPGVTSTTWTRSTVNWTPAAGIRAALVQLVVTGQQGLEAYFDHVWFGESAYGDHG